MLAAFLGASWCAIDWTGAGADEYPGGVVLRDDAGNVLRVSLGGGGFIETALPGYGRDIDCRPYYSADAGDWIVKALVASEDGTFWEHRGVRPLSVLRAAFQNVTCRRRVSGASTITMQAVRLIAPHPKTFWWKWKEAVMALKMERRRSKEWIVSQYLNRAPFGSNLVGIEAAAQGWLGKGAKDLGIGEAAMLAGMVQAPSRFRPDRHYDRALKRRDYVLERMLKLGMIDEGQFEGAKSVKPQIRRAPRPFRAPYFCDWVMGEIRGGFIETALPGDGRGGGGFIETALPGYGRGGAAQDVRTTLNADIQATCENAVDAAARAGGYSVAAVVMEARSGDVKALACSGDYFDKADGQVNTAITPRPAGSTLKPFLAALAIERGVISPDERLCDVPVAYKGYRPANFDGRHRGMVSVRDALVMSLNIPFVQMLRRTGVETFGDCLRELGFRHIGADESAGLGMAIGNVEVSLLELVRAYGVIARGGVAARRAASDILHFPFSRRERATSCRRCCRAGSARRRRWGTWRTSWRRALRGRRALPARTATHGRLRGTRSTWWGCGAGTSPAASATARLSARRRPRLSRGGWRARCIRRTTGRGSSVRTTWSVGRCARSPGSRRRPTVRRRRTAGPSRGGVRRCSARRIGAMPQGKWWCAPTRRSPRSRGWWGRRRSWRSPGRRTARCFALSAGRWTSG
ncbi:MAG: transglycosylase domain-containing protein [Kiritimatiellae bacterium]|nr:transglycosylase domain-containing protein [Kiritimatiellia bacterium]